LIRISLFKKEAISPLPGVISLLTLLLALVNWLQFGLLIDYGSPSEIKETNAEFKILLTQLAALICFVYLIIVILKYVFWKIKKNLHL
jgi:hypothetical protein